MGGCRSHTLSLVCGIFCIIAICYYSGSQHNACAVYMVKHTVSGITMSVLYAHA